MPTVDVENEVEVETSIVVPCYRDEDAIPRLLDELGPVLDELPGTSELVLVDDGSPDATGDVAVELARDFRHFVTVVRLARNFGQHPAVFAGFEASRGRRVVTIDSDLQYPPAMIPELLSHLTPRVPVVAGYRVQRKDPLLRRWISRVMTRWIGRRTGQELRDYGSMFRAYDRRVIDRMLDSSEQRRFIPAIPSFLGFRVLEVPVEHGTRGEGGSRYRLWPLVEMFFDLVTSYSVAPMRSLTFLSLATAILAFFATAALAVYRIIWGTGEAGAVTAFALVFLILAVQLSVTAVMAEYVGRTYLELKRRPYYTVGETLLLGGAPVSARR